MHMKPCNLAIWCLSFFGVSLLAGVAVPAAASPANQPFRATEASMSLATRTAIDAEAIPPIDAAAPSAVETASFGLG